MTSADTTSELRRLLGDIAPDLDLAAVAVDTDLRNDIGLDSMDFLNFVIAANKRFAVAVPEADYGKVTTLSKFARYIDDRRQ